MAPVTFCRADRRPVQPYFISPWQNEGVRLSVPCLVPLRGDFFCVPFGANRAPYRGENHPPHGETAGSAWSLEDYRANQHTRSLRLRLQMHVRPGSITREFSVVQGHNVVYSCTEIEGFDGDAPFAHHAILRMPARERGLLISTSPFAFGMTYPGMFSNPAAREYQLLAPGATFKRLTRVPSLYRTKRYVDYSAFPRPAGFTDLVELFEKPSLHPSWVTAVNTDERWLWFALKNPSMMPGRVLWIENGGRHAPPWNGRVRCLGIEDGCMFFDRGIADSCRPNPISRWGIATCTRFGGKKPVVVPYIQGAANIPKGFGRVTDADFEPSEVTFRSATGRVRLPVCHEFLFNPSRVSAL